MPGASGAPRLRPRRRLRWLRWRGLTVQGTVESVDGDTLTIKTANGQTITVTTGASTTYHTQTAGDSGGCPGGQDRPGPARLAGGVGGGRPNASGAPAAPVGTAGSVTVDPVNEGVG